MSSRLDEAIARRSATIERRSNPVAAEKATGHSSNSAVTGEISSKGPSAAKPAPSSPHPGPSVDISGILNIGRNAYEIESLVRLLNKQRVVPFIGAGLSVPSGYPGWTHFILELAAEAGLTDEVAEDLTKGDYEGAAQRIEDTLESFTFSRRITQTYGEERLATGAVVHLPRLVQGPILTTNFDHVLERVFENSGQPFEERVWGHRFDAVKNALFDRRRYLLKIHGDATDSTDRVLTAREYEQHYASGSALETIATTAFSSSTLLFVGCSLSFDRTMQVFARAAQTDKPLPEHFAIVEIPSGSLERTQRQRELARRRIVPIWYPQGKHEWVPKILEHMANQVTPSPPPNSPVP